MSKILKERTLTLAFAVTITLLGAAPRCLVDAVAQTPLEDQAATAARYLPIPGTIFSVDGHDAWLISPLRAEAASKAWVLFAHTLKGGNPRPQHATLFQRLRDSGVAIAGIDVGESYGSPTGRALFTALYRELVDKRAFSKRPCLLAQSRGGLQIYNWAVEHPDWVAGIAGIFPVGDLTRYPGLAKAHKAYGLTLSELTRDVANHNPIDRLKSLADAHVPLLHIHGTTDSLVPLKHHTAVIAQRYRALGGEIKIIEVPGQGHTLWSGYFENQELIDFIIKAAIGSKPPT